MSHHHPVVCDPEGLKRMTSSPKCLRWACTGSSYYNKKSRYGPSSRRFSFNVSRLASDRLDELGSAPEITYFLVPRKAAVRETHELSFELHYISMGMGAFDVQLSTNKSTSRRPAGLQINKSGSCIKPRIIHTYSPKIYKIKPEEFLDLVQKLTGQTASEETSTFRFIEVDSSSDSDRVILERDASETQLAQQGRRDSANSGEVLTSPVSTQLLAALPSPRFVTLNFLPMLSASPNSFNSTRREGFTFPSAAC